MIYALSKLFTYTLMPPALFIWALLLASFGYLKRVMFLLALLFWFLSTQIGAHLLLEPLENMHLPKKAVNPHYVVVLGGGYDKGALPLNAHATERLIMGLAIAKEHNATLVYTGYEAKYAKKEIAFLQKSLDLTLPVLYEDRSLDTYQNAAFCAKILPKKEIYLVTSAVHMPRAYRLFTHFGFRITPVKTDFRTKPALELSALFPKMDYFDASYAAFHEYVGLLSLIARGI
ncbi:hypothetical protein NitYY0826_C0072 [Nitratiruptor sp. YY08-26]|uniref:YdcF family protein n=2 Tax=unclassified Nitratiruptor TaxID=2624044 RepID=UPI001916678A|nr:YdcF family protein [Nitratiruptor sp. YY08-26]BCD61239.1 hypothetical protein NitYY0813_C0072 [Nitratiruptor sp. YY08-13]BCD65172.1 hypothetical protein NitYY0826_C0072 [Nitratiruptor sp. YY08-26]